jgi:hypothetical protein
MTELLIIKTAEAGKIKNLLDKNKLNYQVIYNEIVQDKELTGKELENQIAKDYRN